MNTPTPTPSKDEVNLDNLPLKDALRFVDENSTTGGLFTKAALKTLAAKCRELTAVTEQRDRLETILKECLYEMPCGYVPNHTIEKLPHMIANQTQLFAEEITHSEKLEKQRDRLVEALERIANNNVQDEPHTCYAYEFGRMEGIAKIALAAVKGGSDDFDQFRPFDF